MATVKAARNSLVTLVEAVTPPSATAVPYRHLANVKTLPDGAAARRVFWFEPRGGAVLEEHGHTSAGYEHRMDLRLALTATGEGTAGIFDMVTDEATLLVQTINDWTTYPAGVDHVQADGYEVRALESEDFEVVINVVVRTQETA